MIGTPLPKVTWIRNCVELTNTFKYSTIEDAHGVYRLEIYKPTPKDSGQYTIRAKNKIDTIETTYQLQFIRQQHAHIPGMQIAHSGYLKDKEEAIIQAAEDALYAKEQYELIKSGGFVSPYRKPHAPVLGPSRLKFATQLRDRTALAGGKVRFACLVIGSDPNIQWLKDDKPIAYGKHVKSLTAEGMTTLDIDKISVDMTGEYKCVASNDKREPVVTSCFMRVFEARQEGDKAEPIFLLSIRGNYK